MRVKERNCWPPWQAELADMRAEYERRQAEARAHPITGFDFRLIAFDPALEWRVRETLR